MSLDQAMMIRRKLSGLGREDSAASLLFMEARMWRGMGKRKCMIGKLEEMMHIYFI